MAVRRCRRCPGSGTILRPSAVRADRHPMRARSGKARLENSTRRGERVKIARARSRRPIHFIARGRRMPTSRCGDALENCGAIAGVACMIVAVDDVFVVPVPTLMKATGFFRAANNASIVADARDDVARKLGGGIRDGMRSRSASSGRPGLGLKAADRAGRGQRRARQLRQARQRLPCDRDRAVCGRSSIISTTLSSDDCASDQCRMQASR